MHNPIRHRLITYRPEVDGLRAVAIILVLVFHAFPRFIRGGFVGVDVFFVISGYLITGIILRSQELGRFSLLDFYSRRIRRIFPALIVVLAFCLSVGWFILLADEYRYLGKHVLGGAFYFANFIFEGEAGYFDTQSELKPLLHLWSLSIEEQFYLVYPLLLLLCYRLGLHPIWLIIAGLLLSFGLNVISAAQNPSVAFFFPHTRAWEFLTGGFIACLHQNNWPESLGNMRLLRRIGNAQNRPDLCAWLGFALVLTAWIGLDSRKINFPSWWALLPTLGAALLILAGEGAWFNRKVLSARAVVFIGLISYPMYLWHWVLLSFLQMTEMAKPNANLRLAALALSIVLAWLTYAFVERRVRFHKHPLVSLGLFAALAVLGLAGFVVAQQQGFPARMPTQASFVAGEIGNEGYQQRGWLNREDCVETYYSVPYKGFPNSQFCLIQDAKAKPTAVLVGDSHANHLYPGLVSNRELTGGNLLNLGGASCFPFYDNPLNPNKKCRKLINDALALAISTPSIKTVILASQTITARIENSFLPKKSLLDTLGFNLKASPKVDDPYTVYRETMRKTLARLQAADKKVVFVLDIPGLEFEPAACQRRPWRLSGGTAIEPCAIPVAKVELQQQKHLQAVRSVLHDFPSVKVWDTSPAFCDGRYCWAIKDAKMLYRDNNHLNETGAVYLAERLRLQ